MTRFTPCTLQISLSTALTASSLHPFSLTSPSGYCLIQMCYPPAHHRHHPPLHASIHCLFLCQCVFFSSIESRARYVNEVNRIVACGEAAQLSQKFPVHFYLNSISSCLVFLVCVYVCVCMQGHKMRVRVLFVSTSLDAFFSLSRITSSLAEISHNHICRSPSVCRGHKCGTELAATSFLPSCLTPVINSPDNGCRLSVDKEHFLKALWLTRISNSMTLGQIVTVAAR